MNINIKATNIDLTPKIKNYIQDKMEILDKYFGQIQIINIRFEVEITTHHHQKGGIYRAEASIAVPGDMLRVEKTEEDIFKAIDKVKDHLARSIIRYKQRYKQKRTDKKIKS